MEVVAEQLEQKALSLPEQAKAVRITDSVSYSQAAELLKGIVAVRKEITEHHAPLKLKAHEAHKAICDAEKKLLEPIATAEQTIKAAIGGYDMQQRRLQEQAEREAREKFEAEQAEMIEAAAVEAESQGASAEEVKAIIEQPLIIPRLARRVETKPAGISTSYTYSAQVVNMRELCRAIADGKAASTLLTPNATALNQLARAMEEQFNIPGCRITKTPRVAVTVGRR